ncbi:9855_t:CDS:1, partial [Cetraspora pellucida]
MDQSDISDEIASYNNFQENNPPHTKISKKRLLETLMIMNNVFKQAIELCVEIKFDHWDHTYL